MRYFIESRGYPMPDWRIQSEYGVDPATSLHLGIYPLVECEPGYSDARYEKDGDQYVCIPLPLSDAELAVVQEARANPELPSYWSNVTEGSGPSSDFRWNTSDIQFINLEVGDVIYGCDPIGAIPVGATCLSKTESSGVTTWSEPTTLSGQDVPFRVTTGKPAAG